MKAKINYLRNFIKKAPSQNWTNLRNSLAHDIESSSIIENEITYLNLKTDREEKYLILNLKQDLIEFCRNLKDIILLTN